ncbi:hypothetical protein HO173_000835 [Letharia columbiana]|uniref:Uncharacterized protein n=1 Tax=Letharia columbiana TaxID=112416 RepID=A0A8H6LA14_9LECA|nr:uncharacterized protein HO173_000835 [Letharia columbiana]KAF6241041.1 hypothetical protein HO173_000835 [Letharia columbiana]
MPIRSTQSSALSLSHLPCLSLLLAPQQGGSKYPWSNGRIVASFVFFGILIISFVAIHIWKGALDATVSPRILMQRSIMAGTCFGISSGGAVFLFVYYILLHPQMILGLGVSAGRTTQYGYYTPVIFLFAVLMAVGSGLLTTLKIGTNTGTWVSYQLVLRLGSGAGFNQPVLAAQTVFGSAT